MLLNAEIKVIATNDGKNNDVHVKADLELTVVQCITTLHMAIENYKNLLTVYAKSKFTKMPNQKQLQKITLGDIWEFSKSQTEKKS